MPFCFFPQIGQLLSWFARFKNLRCEVMTVQNYRYALVSRQILLLTDHAVGTGLTAFWMFWG